MYFRKTLEIEKPEIKSLDDIKTFSLSEVIEIVAEANANLSLKRPIETDFAALIKACTRLSLICDWTVALKPATEEERESAKKADMELAEIMKDEEDEEVSYSTEDDVELITADVVKFVQIISTDPEILTYTEKREAFRLFPKVFNAVRMVM